MKFHNRTVFLFILLTAVITLNARAQSFDYQKRPVFKFDYLKTKVSLKLNTSQTKVKGSVTYLLEANITGADSLRLYVPAMVVDSVMFEQAATNFSIEQGKLVISIPDSTVSGKQYHLKIYYQADPRFGLLKDNEGTIWTSMLPKSHRHWLPSPDHPRVETITTLTLNVPATYGIAATGVKTNEQILGLKRKEVTFRSKQSVPITSVAFATNKFNVVGTVHGIKRIISYAEPNSVNPKKQKNWLISRNSLLLK